MPADDQNLVEVLISDKYPDNGLIGS
jgi:hypothetical protein